MKCKVLIVEIYILMLATTSWAQLCSSKYFQDKRTDAYAGIMKVYSGDNWKDVLPVDSISENTNSLTLNFCIWVPKSSDGGVDVLYVHVSRSRSRVMLFNNKLNRTIIEDFSRWWRENKSFADMEFDYNNVKRQRYPSINKILFTKFHCETNCFKNFYKVNKNEIDPDLYFWHQQMEDMSCPLIWTIWCGDNRMNIPLETEFLLKLKSGRDSPSWIPLELDIYPGETARILSLFSGNNAPLHEHTIKVEKITSIDTGE